MRKTDNPRVPLDLSRLFPHRTNAAFLALDELHGFIASVLAAQQLPHDLDELQEPLAFLAEEIIEIASGGMSLKRWRKRFDAALALCQQAKASLPPLVRASAMSAAQAVEIAARIDLIITQLTNQWTALATQLSATEPDHG